MSVSPRTIPVKRREQDPYRSLYAELLFQSFRDALVAAADWESTLEPISVGSREGKRRQDTAQRAADVQLPERDCLRR